MNFEAYIVICLAIIVGCQVGIAFNVSDIRFKDRR